MLGPMGRGRVEKGERVVVVAMAEAVGVGVEICRRLLEKWEEVEIVLVYVEKRGEERTLKREREELRLVGGRRFTSREIDLEDINADLVREWGRGIQRRDMRFTAIGWGNWRNEVRRVWEIVQSVGYEREICEFVRKR